MIEYVPLRDGELAQLVHARGAVECSFGPGGVALRYDTDKPLTTAMQELCKLRGVSAPMVSWWQNFKEMEDFANEEAQER